MAVKDNYTGTAFDKSPEGEKVTVLQGKHQVNHPQNSSNQILQQILIIVKPATNKNMTKSLVSIPQILHPSSWRKVLADTHLPVPCDVSSQSSTNTV